MIIESICLTCDVYYYTFAKKAWRKQEGDVLVVGKEISPEVAVWLLSNEKALIESPAPDNAAEDDPDV